MQINPPFDGSDPCPACQPELRSIYATLHNAFLRFPDGKAFVGLFDLRHHTIPDNLTVPHPASQELVEVAKALVAAVEGMEKEGLTIRWSPLIRDRVAALEIRTKRALDAFELLVEAHFHDNRHATSQSNLLSTKRGGAKRGFLNPTYEEYAYDVVEVSEGSHLTHKPCGAHLSLHEHFLVDLRKDPTFFGKVRCPRCQLFAPFAQFELHLEVPALGSVDAES